MDTKEMDKYELTLIKKFLISNGCSHFTYEVLDYTAKAVASKLDILQNMYMCQMYEELAAGRTNANSLHAKLHYHIESNHDMVRKSIHANYGYDIGEYIGVKSFIDQIASVYSVIDF